MHNGDVLIQVKSSERDHFTMIPNILFHLDITHTAFKLYSHLRKVCGDDGKCWMSLETLAKVCSMDRRTILAARDVLKAQKLIEIKN